MKQKSVITYVSLITELGISFIAPVIMMTFVGVKLSAIFSISQGWIVFWIMVGLVSGIYNVIQTLKKFI